MSRKMQFFLQLDEKMAETFLADVHCKVLYVDFWILVDTKVIISLGDWLDGFYLLASHLD